MAQFKDKDIIDGIKCSNRTVLKYVYNQYFPLIKWKLLKTTILEEEDAKDIFQDALIVIFKNINQKKFVLECSFKTYLFSVCKMLLLRWLRLNKFAEKRDIIDINDLIDENPFTIDMGNIAMSKYQINEIKRGLIRKYFMQLSNDCQKILKMYSKNFSNKEIAIAMGFKEEYAKTRKQICKGYLTKKILKDKLYKTIKDE